MVEPRETTHRRDADVGNDPSLGGRWGPLSDLPGNPMMWVLIISEIAVFSLALIGFAAARLGQREAFLVAQTALDQRAGAVNTGVLLTSGLAAALAVTASAEGRLRMARGWLAAAGGLGVVFLAVKASEYAAKFSAGIGMDTNTFYTLYFLITGFHAAHVVAGIAILALVAWWGSLEAIETGAAFWHMIDLIWVLLFPVIYLMR